MALNGLVVEVPLLTHASSYGRLWEGLFSWVSLAFYPQAAKQKSKLMTPYRLVKELSCFIDDTDRWNLIIGAYVRWRRWKQFCQTNVYVTDSHLHWRGPLSWNLHSCRTDSTRHHRRLIIEARRLVPVLGHVTRSSPVLLPYPVTAAVAAEASVVVVGAPCRCSAAWPAAVNSEWCHTPRSELCDSPSTAQRVAEKLSCRPAERAAVTEQSVLSVTRWLQVRFDCNSTALWPLDDPRCDSRPTYCELLHWGINK